MITREERKKLVDEEFTFLAISDAYSLIDKIYNDFESQLSRNPLQLTCEGCKYYDATMYVEYCDGCKRNENIIDFYTKDTK